MKLIIGNKNYSSWSMRPWVMMKHAGIPFEEVFIALREPDTSARIREHSPSSKVPCLVMDDGGALFDSRVIAEYADTLSPVARLIPPSGRERVEVRCCLAP